MKIFNIPSGIELFKCKENPTPALSAAAVGTLPLAEAEIHVRKLISNCHE